MTTRTDYTDDEWTHIKAGPLLAGLFVSVVSKSGPIDTAREALAVSESLTELATKGSANELIATLIEESKPKEGEAVQSRENIAVNVKTPVELRLAAIDTLQKASAALTKATPEETAEYKQFVLMVAQRVAQAGKEGGFMGIGGTRVSENETRAIQEISAALGVAA